MKRLIVVAALLLAGCDKAKPIVAWTCIGCTALLASGVCEMARTAEGQKVTVPECKSGEVLIVENWKAVSRKGALLKLGCERP